MNSLEELFSRFVDEWNAGRRPPVELYIDQAEDESARAELADQIQAFLAWAPTPPYGEETVNELVQDPAVMAAVDVFATEQSAWPRLLPAIRERLGLSIEDAAQRLLKTAGLGEGGTSKAAAYVAAIESGKLDARSISRRAIHAMSQVFRINVRDLEHAGLAAPEVAGALYRRDDEPGRTAPGVDLAALADAMSVPAPSREWDEVDHFFLNRE